MGVDLGLRTHVDRVDVPPQVDGDVAVAEGEHERVHESLGHLAVDDVGAVGLLVEERTLLAPLDVAERDRDQGGSPDPATEPPHQQDHDEHQDIGAERDDGGAVTPLLAGQVEDRGMPLEHAYVDLTRPDRGRTRRRGTRAVRTRWSGSTLAGNLNPSTTSSPARADDTTVAVTWTPSEETLWIRYW